MVLVGKVNKDIVSRINRHGQPAVGLSGDDGQLFRVSTMAGPGGEDIGFVGKIERVDVGVINHIAEDYIPVIASVGADRDRALAQHQRRRGRGRDRPRPGRLQGDLPHRRRGLAARSRRPRQRDLRGRGRRGRGRAGRPCRAACGRSSQACVEAIHGGVTYAHIIDGRLPHSLLLELFTDAGIGTKVRPAS